VLERKHVMNFQRSALTGGSSIPRRSILSPLVICVLYRIRESTHHCITGLDKSWISPVGIRRYMAPV
jgi:hypothetical protein